MKPSATVPGSGMTERESCGRREVLLKVRESARKLTILSAANILRLRVPPERISAEKDGARASEYMKFPLVAPLKLKVPRASSAPLRKLFRVE